jgi:TPR repeat protein
MLDKPRYGGVFFQGAAANCINNAGIYEMYSQFFKKHFLIVAFLVLSVDGLVLPQAMAEPLAVQPVLLVNENGPTDPEAQYLLGMRYGKGEGVPRDDALAREWLARAAVAGHLKARYALGWLYYDGRGVQQDYPKAAELFTQAAQAGDADAQYMLGVMHAQGQGVERSLQRSLEWMRRAAAQGHVGAKATLSGLLNPTPSPGK